MILSRIASVKRQMIAAEIIGEYLGDLGTESMASNRYAWIRLGQHLVYLVGNNHTVIDGAKPT